MSQLNNLPTFESKEFGTHEKNKERLVLAQSGEKIVGPWV